MTTAIILAAGRGARYGTALPKQFVDVLGKPILAYTLEAFQQSPEIDAIQVVCQPEYFERVERIAKKGGIAKLRRIVPGGDTCPLSIRSGLYALRDALSDDDIILIHMAVSPLVSREDIASAVRICRERSCCFTMHPVTVCMARRGDDGWADGNAPKEDYVEMNVPWAFRYGDVYALYRGLEDEGRALTASDYTLGLWLAAGHRAWYAPGSAPGRLKITTEHDRDLFEAYLMWQERREIYHE